MHYDDVVEDAIGNSQQMKAVSRNKLQLGEDLFHKVAEIETELCAQVTGRCDLFSLFGPFTPPIFRRDVITAGWPRQRKTELGSYFLRQRNT